MLSSRLLKPATVLRPAPPAQVTVDFRQMLLEQMSRVSKYLAADEAQVQAEVQKLQSILVPGADDALQSVVYFAQLSSLASRVEGLQNYAAINFVAINKVRAECERALRAHTACSKPVSRLKTDRPATAATFYRCLPATRCLPAARGTHPPMQAMKKFEKQTKLAGVKNE
eukprot:SAG22_NODE_10916_length_510_cov_0.486618_1_plen_169_part_11